MSSNDTVVPTDVLTSLGEVTVSFAVLELQLKALIGTLLGTHQRIATIVCAKHSVKDMLLLVKSMYVEHYGDGDPELPELSRLLSTAGQLADDRNRYQHSLWGAAGYGSTSSSVRIKPALDAKKGLHLKSEETDAATISASAEKMRECSAALLSFHVRLSRSGKTSLLAP